MQDITNRFTIQRVNFRYKGVKVFDKEKKLIKVEVKYALGTLLVFMAAVTAFDAEKLIF